MIWWILLGIGLIFFIIVSPTFRCAVFNPIKVVVNGGKDIYKYFKEKQWNDAPYGFINAYIAQDSKAFGCGKTLTSAEYLVEQYKQYNDKDVWDNDLKEYVKQKIVIFSMVEFKTIPYIKLTSMNQYVSYLKERYEKDKEEKVRTVSYLYIDEAGSAFNSRSFKENFSPTLIATILTARHYKSACILTAQRFNLIDALWRQVTNRCISCDKLWRFQRTYYYDAYEMENSSNPTMVEPYAKRCDFITDAWFANYNTYQLLDDLEKKVQEGDMLTEEEILNNLQLVNNVNMDGVLKPSKKFTKSRKKMAK